MLRMMGFELNSRETTCYVVAAVLHSFLFLLKGGMLALPGTSGGGSLGEPLVTVGYMSDAPEYAAPGDEGRKTGFIGKMKKFFAVPAKQSAPGGELASGGAPAEQKIKTGELPWDKTAAKLTDKKFSSAQDFKGMQTKNELAMAVGQEKPTMIANQSVGSAVVARPNLKEKSFQVSRRDVPFKVASGKELDSLSNVNMVPVNVGKQTTADVRSMEAPGSGGMVGGAALKSKDFGGGSSASSSGGFSGLSKSPGRSGSSDGLASGSMSGTGGTIDVGAGAAGDGGGQGYAGTGTGGGGSTPGATGHSGRGGGGGSGGRGMGGFGTGASGSASTAMLPRQQLSQTGVSNSSRSNEMITGELAQRPIKSRVKPEYEMDARVVLRFRVNASGNVMEGIVIEISSGNPTFDQKVIAALKRWTFVPLPTEKSNVVQSGLITFIFRGE